MAYNEVVSGLNDWFGQHDILAVTFPAHHSHIGQTTHLTSKVWPLSTINKHMLFEIIRAL